jgi:hypothetical protein
MGTNLLHLEPLSIDRVTVVALDDTARLLLPQCNVHERVNGHDLGVVCNVIAGALLCSVWDLSVYQVPPIALEMSFFQSAYAAFDSRNKSYIFLGYYGITWGNKIEELNPSTRDTSLD